MIFLTSKTSQLSSGWQLIGALLLFLFVLGACYIATKIVGGIKLNQMKYSNFQVIETYRISQNKYLQIVKVGSKYIVLAISKDYVNFITELQEEEILRIEQSNYKKESFSDIFSKLTKGQNNILFKSPKSSLEKEGDQLKEMETGPEITKEFNNASQDHKNN